MSKFSTRAIHAGGRVDTACNSVMPPLYPSSTFSFDAIGKNKGYDYTRSGNPTRACLESTLNALEGGSGCLCTATGMAAITAVLSMCKPGDHIVAGHDIYGGSFRLLHDVYRPRGVAVSFVDMTTIDNVVEALTPRTKLLWIETPSNPLLRVVDIAALAQLGRSRGIVTALDNTFLTPCFQRPLERGIDIVIHSTTKYINGHSDVIGGAVIAASEHHYRELAFLANALGLTESPWDAWMVLRGVKTLAQRMEAHARNAQVLAEFLAEHPAVKKVYYPGLPSHPQHALAAKQSGGFGGMVTFDIDADKGVLDQFFSRLRYFALAESLGGVESLIEAPWFMSHASMSDQHRRAAGISPGTVRVSAGLEDSADLLDDLRDGLSKL